MTLERAHAESETPRTAGDHDPMIVERARARRSNKGFGGYLHRHWRGELSLARALWLNGILAMLVPGLLSLPLSTPPAALREQPGAVRVFAGLWVLAVALRLAAQIWWNVGLWRSATYQLQRGGRRLWAYLARVVVVAAVALQIGGIGYVARSSGLVPLQILLGRDALGKARLQVSPDGETLVVSGELGAGFATELLEALHHSAKVRTLRLSSYGGRLYEAIAAAKQLHALRLNTRVEDHCYSGCTILFLAGRERSVGTSATLGFHKPIIGDIDGRDSDVEIELGAMKELGAPEAFVARIRALTAREVWYPTVGELFEYRVTTIPATDTP